MRGRRRLCTLVALFTFSTPAAPAPGAPAQAFLVTESRLWVSDGTAAGTIELTPPAPARLFHPLRRGEELFFVDTKELWHTDGTPAGTGRVRDLMPWLLDWWTPRLYGREITTQALVEQRGMVYFFFDDTLWRSDGSKEGTRPVWESLQRWDPEGCCLGASSEHLFFFADAPEPSRPGSHRRRLWAYDPATERAAVIRGDLLPRGDRVVALGDRVFFAAYDRQHGGELATAEPETAAMVLDLRPGSEGSGPWSLAVAAGRLWFTADDGEHGREPWVSDGTAAGSRRLADLEPGVAGSQLTTGFVAAAGGVCVGALVGSSREGAGRPRTALLVCSDGTPVGTRQVAALPLPATEAARWGIQSLVAFGERLAFTFDDGRHGREPWVSDRTPDGTRMIADLQPGPRGSIPAHLTPLDRRRFLFDCAVAPGPWVSDGSAAGTLPLQR